MKLLLFLLLFSAFQTYSQDSVHFVTVHVIYGSKPKARGEEKWFGGKWGGHVGLEISPGKVVHFNPGGRVKANRRNSVPGTYDVSGLRQFYCTFGCDTVKTMQVKIQVSAEEAKRLDSISEIYHESAPYSYAFFGMRCAAACYHLLSWANVYDERSENRMIRRFFYPRRLRRFLINSAKENHWEITYGKGSESRKWDHD